MLKGIKKSIVFLLCASTIISNVVCYAEKTDKEVQEDVVVNEYISTNGNDYASYIEDGDLKNSEKSLLP